MIEVLAIINNLLKIGDSIAGFIDRFKKSPNKEHIAAWLHHVGVLVESVAYDLQSGNYPHSKCAEMEYYTSHVDAVLRDSISMEEADNLKQLLIQSCNIERLFGEFQQLDHDAKNKNLAMLLAAAGKFSAASTILKVI